jgi:cyclopropane-fatty-acyl-phospholipid synthase
MNAEKVIISALEEADIQINGSREWDIHIHDTKTYRRVLAQGSLGFGEAYMDGWWDCRVLDAMFCRLLRAGLEKKVSWTFPVIINKLRYMLLALLHKQIHILKFNIK